MEEKVLVQYRYADDEKYHKGTKAATILLVAGIIGWVLFFVLLSCEYPLSLFASLGLMIGFYCIVMWLVVFPNLKKYGKTHITVTTKSVYGRALNREENIPVDAITAVSKNKKNKLYVSSPSGRVVFAFCTTQKTEEVYQLINKLIAERQSNTESAPVVNDISVPDELKKYKELADTGVITQEEFEAKKKQLLGL